MMVKQENDVGMLYYTRYIPTQPILLLGTAISTSHNDFFFFFIYTIDPMDKKLGICYGLTFSAM